MSDQISSVTNGITGWSSRRYVSRAVTSVHHVASRSPLDEERLTAVFGALADRTRRAILAQLSRDPTNVAGLTELFDMSQPAVSKHLKVLENAGLISRTQQGTMRLSHLEAEPLKGATSWLADYRTYWDESYRRLDDLLTQMD